MAHETGWAVKLPQVVTIGFVAQAGVEASEACREVMQRLLREESGREPWTLLAIVGGLESGGLLFAEACLAMGVSFRVLLVEPAEALPESNQGILKQALAVDALRDLAPGDDRRQELSLQTVQRSQKLIALGDGGSTKDAVRFAEVVAFAGKLGKPVISLHCSTAVAEELLTGGTKNAIAVDAELEFFNGLPFTPVAFESGLWREVADAWFLKLDEGAARVAPQVRRLAAVPIVCTAMAAFASAAALHGKGSGVWLIAAGALGVVAAALPAVLRLGKRQALWVRLRTAAEVSRSVLALWETPLEYDVVGAEVLPELKGMLASLNFMKAYDVSRGSVAASEYATRYLDQRLIDQKNYFARQTVKASVQGERFRLVAMVCTCSAIGMSVWMFAGRLWFKPGSEALGGHWMALLTSALFQGATVAGALKVVNDCERRRRRYQEVHDLLATMETELRAFGSWTSVMRIVNKVERALLAELLEWRSLLQNMKMPRN